MIQKNIENFNKKKNKMKKFIKIIKYNNNNL